ncbi:MAG: ribose 5-phosphate isomerase B [Desulfohalobiaceae bacterium]
MENTSMVIALASDHAGFRYKERIKSVLENWGYRVRDFGTSSEERVDYPPYIRAAALAVTKGECDAGIVLGGSGNGEAIAANKVRGVRCAVCWNTESARLAKEHNNANLIALGQRLLDADRVPDIVRAWLEAGFQGGRHQKRIEQLEEGAFL